MPAVAAFLTCLSNLDLDSFETHPGIIFGLDRDLRLAYVNAAWERFARANDGTELLDQWALGCRVLDAVAAPLQRFYRSSYSAVRGSGQALGFEYDASNAACFRRCEMLIQPLLGEGLLVVNTVRMEIPHELTGRETLLPSDQRYREPGASITQCAHCRRVRRRIEPFGWDWVPEYVRGFGHGASQDLCGRCRGHFYPEAALPQEQLWPLDALTAAISPVLPA